MRNKVFINFLFLASATVLTNTAYAQDGDASLDAPLPASSPEEVDDRGSDCFSGDNKFKCTLRADNDPKKIENSQPASFAYTSNSTKDDTIAIQAAIKAIVIKNQVQYGLKAQWHKNNAQDKEQDNLSLGTSVGFQFTDVENSFDNWISAGQPKDKGPEYYNVYLDFDLSYNRKGLFGDATAAACVATPELKACGDQYLDTLRAQAILSPWSTKLHKTDAGEPNGFYWLVTPTFKLFHDEALNSTVELLDDTQADGGVTGVQAAFTLSLSPDFADNKWLFSILGQHTEAFSQSDTREADFQNSSPFLKLSLDYALGGTFVGQKTPNTFIPAVGVSYSNGADPLNGLEDQKIFSVGLKVKY